MKKIVIASACRTAIGKFGGTLANVPAAELGSIVIKEALNRANVKPEQVDHVYMGCVIQAGLGQNVARQASLKAGLPIETPAVTVNVVCGSGLNCVNMAAQMIEAGDADIVVAGGMENMDMAPFALQKARYGYRMGAPMGKSEIVDTMVNDALWDACGFNKHMGMTAENVCTNETYQKKYGYSPITREMLDDFAYNSQLKADKAIKDGAFKDEIVPVVIKGKKGDTVFDTDEGPRLSAPEVLAKLKPAFTKDGIVTAANSSAINDGAAALVIMSEEKAKELGAKRCLPLKVSGPFHTSLLAPAGDALREKFKETAFGAMRIPVLFNCLGREMGPEDTIPALLEKQVQTSVYMEDTIRRLAELGVDTIVEIGPGKALSGFVKKTAPAIKTYAVETCADLDALSAALKG